MIFFEHNESLTPQPASPLAPATAPEAPKRFKLDSVDEDALPTEGDWFVLHTKSRQEKTLHETLCAKGIGSFLPQMRTVRYYGKRKVKVVEPMFSGYVFMRGSREDTFFADRTRRLANILPVPDQQRLDAELRNLHRAMIAEAPVQPYVHLTKGVWAQVRCGPFKGLQGVVDIVGAAGRLVLQVDMLGRAMSLEIDASLLDRIEEP